VTPQPSICRDPALAPAGDFNVFVLGDLQTQNSDTEGKMAVCGNASLTNYSIGGSVVGLMDVLVVGGDVAYLNGTVYGNATFGGFGNFANVGFANGGVPYQAPAAVCSGAATTLAGLCTGLQSLPVNGTTTVQYGIVTFSGSDPLVNVFSVSAATIASANTLNVAIPAGATAIVNVGGVNGQFAFQGFQGHEPGKVLYTLCDAGSLVMNGVGVPASILAPNADVAFNNGQMDGQLIAGSLVGYGEFHVSPFDGCLPVPLRSRLGVSRDRTTERLMPTNGDAAMGASGHGEQMQQMLDRHGRSVGRRVPGGGTRRR